MLLIYTAINSSRFSYIAEVLFLHVRPVKYSITTNAEEFRCFTGPKIDYGPSRLCQEAIWIPPHSLLLETSVRQQEISCFDWEGIKVFFKTTGDLPFDIFAASFYLVSRYEEYLPHAKDEYGRYDHKNSLAYKEHLLHLPLINLWMAAFAKFVQARFPTYTIQSPAFTFIPTYDIDIAYAYKGRRVLRNVVGAGKDILTGHWKQLIERVRVLGGTVKDPFDTYSWLNELHSHYHLQPVYFFLLAAKSSIYDKNISPRTKEMQQLIKEHAEKYNVGIHPSWQSGDHVGLIKTEVNALMQITGVPVTRNRQHYIRMTVPDTYRSLIEMGIKEDHTMGYGSANGFRASVASSYYWYDLEKDIKTNLLIQPYCYMEANSYFEQHYTAQQAAEELQQYYEIVKLTGGKLVTIFHNHFLTQQPQWVDWRKMYASFLEKNFA